MVYLQSLLSVADNSGAQSIKCFRIYKKTHRSSASTGDLLLGSVK